jgi:hypothetical protein
MDYHCYCGSQCDGTLKSKFEHGVICPECSIREERDGDFLTPEIAAFDALPDEVTIHLHKASDGGYLFEIYHSAPEDVEDTEAHDGGQCTSNFSVALKNAVEMAASQTL